MALFLKQNLFVASGIDFVIMIYPSRPSHCLNELAAADRTL